jgi:hypothetical protein
MLTDVSYEIANITLGMDKVRSLLTSDVDILMYAYNIGCRHFDVRQYGCFDVKKSMPTIYMSTYNMYVYLQYVCLPTICMSTYNMYVYLQ